MKNKIILINPSFGALGDYILDMPVSLLYAASAVVKSGYRVEVFDFRVDKDWRSILTKEVDDTALLVGITVMAGFPIKNVIEVSKFLKANYKVPIVYGGPHPTIIPEIILKEDYVDFLIRGFGSNALRELSDELKKDSPDFSNVTGLSWEENGKQYFNQCLNNFEEIHYEDIPYFLFKKYFDKYIRIDEEETIFPIYSNYGCPYKCSFCMAATRYKGLKKKWQPLEEDYVVQHIKYLKEKNNARYFYFYDDTALVDKSKTLAILARIKELHFDIKVGFRGMRIDELSRLTDEELILLVEAGVGKIHVGVESGSPRILKLLNKEITVKQIIQVNKRLSAFAQIRPYYNFLSGIPGETIEDLVMTKDLIFKLIKDNPNCIILPVNKYQPYPGSVLYEEAIKHGFSPPKSLEEWIKLDDIGNDIYMPWYTKKYNDYINMLKVASYFIDNKLLCVPAISQKLKIIVKLATLIGKPFFSWRLRYNISFLSMEHSIYRYASKFILSLK